MVMYNANQKLVDDLVDRKRSENLVKEHPDFPENPQMNMYWVLLAAIQNDTQKHSGPYVD